MQGKLNDVFVQEIREIVRSEIAAFFSRMGGISDPVSESARLTPGQKAVATKRAKGTLSAIAKKAARTKAAAGTHKKAARKAARTRKKNLLKQASDGQ